MCIYIYIYIYIHVHIPNFSEVRDWLWILLVLAQQGKTCIPCFSGCLLHKYAQEVKNINFDSHPCTLVCAGDDANDFLKKLIESASIRNNKAKSFPSKLFHENKNMCRSAG